MNERLKKIAMLREKVEEKATREKFLMLCPSIKEFEIISGKKIASLVNFLIDETPNPIKVMSELNAEQVINEIKEFERELTSLLSKKIIVWYAHENWDFGVQLEDFMLYTKEVLHFIGYDDAQRGLIYSSLIVVDEAMRSAFSFLKNEYNVEIVLWKES
ncbi:hypothetical protein COD10_17015 [Bacillus thuringiensis]|uniref:hypothetical protein n=2 Tax=Bacillaceae TaxID=186817 RepID=UPI000BED3F78|nr:MULTISPECIES: hypothetical protein [Bacillus]MCP1323505.1 hypothetical protein [Bacillus sp. S0628]PEF31579.1 hypothetical protein CON39_04790 [Bacillus thuringiensis]PET90694.1 hypothetical protein CN529_12630 [Bacillus thuringiensis]PEU98741.1 hypothetical protein CN409_11230 [Bacillus sp. AFS012607]PEY55931.1 hypothetical protein CN359_12545 [Bacillus thuringiensis]